MKKKLINEELVKVNDQLKKDIKKVGKLIDSIKNQPKK
jgi:hypothetical protein